MKKNSLRLESLRNTLQRMPLTVSVVARMVVDDPLLFTVQTLRKAPRGVRYKVSRLIPRRDKRPGVRALRPFLLDHRAEASELLSQTTPTGKPDETRRQSRLADELRIQLGHPIVDATDTRTVARLAWESGDVDLLATLPISGRQKQRYEGELRILRPGWGISLPDPHSDAPRSLSEAPQQESNLRALHILTNSLPWTRSGYTYRTQNLLKALQDVGVDVLGVTRIAYPTVIGGLSADQVDIVDGVPYERLFPSSWPADPSMRLVRQTQMLLPIVERFRPNVLHTTTNYQNALVTDAVSRATGIPWIYEMRGNMEQTWVARKPGPLQEAAKNSKRYKLMRARETEMALRADRVIVLSNIQKQDLISRGIPEDKIIIVPNSVDEKLLRIPRKPVKARRALGIPEDGFWVGSVTSVVDYEGLPILVDAVAKMVESGLNARCAIVGDGVALPEVRDQIQRLKLQDRILTPGRVPREEALLWYQALDTFVIPRLDTEVTRTVTPIKGLEAQALGVPVVISDLPPLVESSSQGSPVVPATSVSDLANTLQQLAMDKKRLASLEGAARAFAQSRSWGSAAAIIRETYANIGDSTCGSDLRPSLDPSSADELKESAR